MAVNVGISQNSTQVLCRWYDERLLSKTPVLTSSMFGWIFGLFGQAAVTINKTIHLTKYATDMESISGTALIGHELFHVVQQQQMGWWRFILRYLWYWRPKHISQGESHPMEKSAYDRQREIESSL